MQHTLKDFTEADLRAARKSIYQVAYSDQEIDTEITKRFEMNRALNEVKITNQR